MSNDDPASMPDASDPWSEYEGIPLCHVPATEDEKTALRRKGVCGPAC